MATHRPLVLGANGSPRQLPVGDDLVVTATGARVVALTQAEYDALGTPDAATIYVITA